MKVAIVGTGFVGVTSCGVYASFGNEVVGLDIDEQKVASLNMGKVPFYEPKLEEMIKQGLESGKLRFTTSYLEAVQGAHVVMIAVGTPSAVNGAIDLTYIEQAVQAAAPHLEDECVLVIKSTVLPGTLKKVKKIVKAITDKKIYYASVPEFLKEGTAVDDTLYPDRIALGVENDTAFGVLQQLHAPLKAPMLKVKPESAQLAKYASNDYLALRIVYANVLAEICEQSEADIDEVIQVMGYEKRIGDHYWYPGLGYGGSCFPKDVKALAHYCHQLNLGQNLFAFINELNCGRPLEILDKLEQALGTFAGKKVAVLGLAFKPNTDDQREAPALSLIPHLLQKGAEVASFDPMVKKIAEQKIANDQAYKQATTIEEAVKDSDLIVALIEWPQIVGFDFSQVKSQKPQFFFDARNQFVGKKLTDAGYVYLSVGRSSVK